MTSPIEAIETLKTLLEKELITSDEYDSRRAQVLDGLAPAPATAQFTIAWHLGFRPESPDGASRSCRSRRAPTSFEDSVRGQDRATGAQGRVRGVTRSRPESLRYGR